MFKLDENFYFMDSLENLINEIKDVNFINSRGGLEYANAPFSFDIETSSFYEGENKRAIMYAFVFGFPSGKCVLGRYWSDFDIILDTLEKTLNLSDNKRIIVYVHNLAYEFAFISHRLSWSKVFAIEERKPIYAITDRGIEFRCSYILSGYPLYKVGENLLKYKVFKMVGDLDYKKLRHSETPLTFEEWKYILHDGLIVLAYIQEEIENNYNNIHNLTLTKTGVIRKYCRKKCLFENPKGKKGKSTKFLAYHDFITGLSIKSPQEYAQLKRAFMGGFTHANAMYSGVTMENVTSYDFSSSYPAVLISRRFPMSQAEKVKPKNVEEFNKYLKLYCCLFDITFYNIKLSQCFESYISESKTWDTLGAVTDNGRIAQADRLSITITELDYDIILKMYTWDKMVIKNMRVYKRGYLPTELVEAILKLYNDKTKLKNVEGKELEYMYAKQNINSVFGMTCTDIVRQTNEFIGGEWEVLPRADSETGTLPNDFVKDALNKYNNSFNRFLFYPWGVWCTAYARHNLFTGILELGNDYIYSDTDSLKAINMDKHMDYINAYNKRQEHLLEVAMKYHNLPIDLVKPKTIEGKEKILGLWDFDGFYNRFKTLGAKRYMVEHDGSINITVSGLNKAVCVPFLCEGWSYSLKDKKEKNSPFSKFEEGLYVPKQYTGKNIHTYLDFYMSGVVTDYLGNKARYMEYSSVHLEEADYTLSISLEYLDYMLNIKEVIH